MTEIIRPGNSVWFHNHSEGYPCDPNCYEQTTDHTPRRIPHYFARVDGKLRMVFPITFPSERDRVLVRVPGGPVISVHARDLGISY